MSSFLDKKREFIIEKQSENYSIQQISKMLDVKQGTLHSYCVRKGIKTVIDEKKPRPVFVDAPIEVNTSRQKLLNSRWNSQLCL